MISINVPIKYKFYFFIFIVISQLVTIAKTQQTCTDFPISVSNISDCIDNNCSYKQRAAMQISLQAGSTFCVKFTNPNTPTDGQVIRGTVLSAIAYHSAYDCYFTDDPIFLQNFVGVCAYNVFSSSICPSIAPHTPFSSTDVCISFRQGQSDCAFGTSCGVSGWISPSVLPRYQVCRLQDTPTYEISISVFDGFDNTTHNLIGTDQGVTFYDPTTRFNLTLGIPSFVHSLSGKSLVIDTTNNHEYLIDDSLVNGLNENSISKFGYYKLAPNGTVIIPSDSNLYFNPNLLSCANNQVEARWAGKFLRDVTSSYVRSIEGDGVLRGMMWLSGGQMNYIGYDDENQPVIFPISGIINVAQCNLTTNVSLCYAECALSQQMTVAGGFPYNIYPCVVRCPDFTDITLCTSTGICAYNTSQIHPYSTSTAQAYTPAIPFYPSGPLPGGTIDIRVYTNAPVIKNAISARGLEPVTVYSHEVTSGSCLAAIDYLGLYLSFVTISATPSISSLKQSGDKIIANVRTLDLKSTCYYSFDPHIITTSAFDLDIFNKEYEFPVGSTYNGTLTMTVACGLKSANKSIIVDINAIATPNVDVQKFIDFLNPASDQSAWKNNLKISAYVAAGSFILWLIYRFLIKPMWKKRSPLSSLSSMPMKPIVPMPLETKYTTYSGVRFRPARQKGTIA